MSTCWLYRRMVSSHVDANTLLPGWVRRHTQNCAECRQFHETVVLTADQLRATADRERIQPRFLHGQIMRAIRAEESVGVRARRYGVGWAVAAVGCILLSGGILWMRQPTGRQPLVNGVATVPTELGLTVNLPSAKQMEEWTTRLDEPLHNETELVLNDAKAAINSLKKSLLPEELLSSSSDTAH